jgi:hypothetical protein
MLIAKLIRNLEASIVNLEVEFLHDELQEEIYMNIPEGMSYDSNHCLLLTKTIFGLVQSAREFHKNLMSTLKLIGFKFIKSNPCLLSKWTQDGVIMIGIYVDDCLVIGKHNGIDELIIELKTSGFNLKVENNLIDYLSCQLIENSESKGIFILQPHLINNWKQRLEMKQRAKGFTKLQENQDLKLFPLK